MNKILALLTKVSILSLFAFANVYGQCDMDPLWIDDPASLNVNETTSSLGAGFCPDDIDGNSETLLDPMDATYGQPTAEDGTAGATADCADVNICYTFTDAVVVNDGCMIEIERTWVATYDSPTNYDGSSCNNVGGIGMLTDVQSIIIMDDEDPILTCPSDITIELTDACDEFDSAIASESGFDYGGDVTDEATFESATDGMAEDNCDTDLELSYTDSPLNVMPGNCPGPYATFTRTWTATDNCGLMVNCDQLIELYDNTPPTIDAAPADEVISVATTCDEFDPEIANVSGFAFDAGPVTVTEADFTNAGGSYTELCPITAEYSDVYTPGLNCPEIGVIERTWTIYDDCGNVSGTEIQTFSLIDDTPPVIDVCASTQEVDIIDNCDETDSGIAATTGLAYDPGPAPATDADFTGAGGAITENCDPTTLVITYSDGPITAMPGNCPGPFLTFIRTWTVEDGCGNGGVTCDQTINLNDVDPPTFAVPADLDIDPGCDELDPEVQTQSGFPFDDSGSATVTVADFIAAGGSLMDNCELPYPNLIITYTDVYTSFPNNCPDEVGEIVRTWSVTDECGNMAATIDQSIKVYDLTPPTIDSCPGPTTTIAAITGDPCDNTNPDIALLTGFPFSPAATPVAVGDFPGTASDNCNGGDVFEVTYEDVELSNQCSNFVAYEFERIWTVTDECGNSATCSENIQITDNEAPILQGLEDFFYDQDSDNPLGPFTFESIFCEVTANWTEPTPNDFDTNCGPNSIVSIVGSDTPPLLVGVEGGYDVTYTVTDECGNTAEYIFTINMTCVDCGPDQVFEDCEDPPTLCDLTDIANFASCTPPYGGSPLEGLCSGFVVNNPSYFEFIAGEEVLTLTVTPSSCANGQGIQAAVIDPCMPTNCYDDDGGNCHNTPFSITASGLTVGNIYQLIVDGCAGDECNWTVDVSTVPFQIDIDGDDPEFTVAGCSVDELDFCVGSEVTFFPSSLEEALYYFCWSLDNLNGVNALNNEDDCTDGVAPTPSGLGFQCSNDFSSCGPLVLEFTEAGVFTLCLAELENGCDNEQPDFCWEITITQPGDIDFGIAKVCQHDLIAGWEPDYEGPNGEDWEGGLINSGGIDGVPELHEFEYVDECGCIFNHVVQTIMLEEVSDFKQQELCADEVNDWEDFDIGVDWNEILNWANYPEPGIIEALITVEEASNQFDWNGNQCDTTIFYEFIVYDLFGDIVQTPGAACDEILSFEIDYNNLPSFMDEDDLEYSWTNDNNDDLGTDPEISVTDETPVQLTMSYFREDGVECTWMFEFFPVQTGSTPAAPSVTGNPFTCETELTGLLFSTTFTDNTTWNWTVTNGTFVPGATGNEILVDVTDPTMPVVVSVNTDSACGPSPDGTATLTVTPSPEVELPPVAQVCVGSPAVVTSNVTSGVADSYNWVVTDPNAQWSAIGSEDDPSVEITWTTPGMQEYCLSIEDAGGCTSMVVCGMVEVVEPQATPTFTCDATSNSITITVTDADPGSPSTLQTTSPGHTATMLGPGVWEVTGLMPGDVVTYILTNPATGHPCGPQFIAEMCTAGLCPLDPMISTPQDNVCVDGTAPFDLDIDNDPGGTFSGPGITDAMAGTFDPLTAGVGTHTIGYEVYDPVNDCTRNATTMVTVIDLPMPTLTPSALTVCVDETFTVDYNSSNPPSDWEFGMNSTVGDILNPPFDLSYSMPGMYTLSYLDSSGPDCEGMAEVVIEVLPSIDFTGTIDCSSTTNSIDVTWPLIPGITEYEVTIIIEGGMPMTTTESGPMLPITGLSTGDVVEITIMAQDMNGCGDPILTATCVANDCQDFTVEIDPPDFVACFDPANPTVVQLSQMTFDENGDLANGTGEWSGDDIDPVTGEWTPSGVGVYTLTYTFAEDGSSCPGVAEVVFEILDSPVAAFTVDEDEICVEDVITLTYDGTFSSSLDFNWTSDLVEGTDYDILDNGDGTWTVNFYGEVSGEFTLETVIGNCSDTSMPQAVSVQTVPVTPTISCGASSLSSVSWTWSVEDCADSYDIYIDGQFVEQITVAEYEVTGLNQNDEVEIEVIINAANDCLCDFPDPIGVPCIAQDCAPGTIDIDATVSMSFCQDDLPGVTDFVATANGSEINNTGTYTWSGNSGVNADGSIDYSALTPGTYTVNVEYEEDGCFYNGSTEFTIYAEPEVVLTYTDAPCPENPIGLLDIAISNGADSEGPYTISANGQDLNLGSNDLGVGDYALTFEDANGCTFSEEFSIASAAQPAFEVNDLPISVVTDSVGVFTYNSDAEGLTNVVWTVDGETIADIDCATGDCANFTYSPTEQGTFEVCAFATYGESNCELVDCRSVETNPIIFKSFYIPNVISPTDDNGSNQNLNIYVQGCEANIKNIKIFDRWGNRVYNEDLDMIVASGASGMLWDGTFQGESSNFSSGVYVYLVEIEFNGQTEFLADDVTVLF